MSGRGRGGVDIRNLGKEEKKTLTKDNVFPCCDCCQNFMLQPKMISKDGFA